MAKKVKPRVKVPKSASIGEVITIKTLISHDMESGQRKDKEGNVIPRHIINHFVASFNGTEVISVDMEPGISANPYFQFSMTLPDAGEFHFAWTDDDGQVFETTKSIAVA